jgi:hypothetical protein
LLFATAHASVPSASRGGAGVAEVQYLKMTDSSQEKLVRSLSREGEVLVSRPQNVSPKIIFVHHL